MHIKPMFSACLMSAVLMSVAYPLAVHFDFDKANLKLQDGSKAAIDRVAREMKDYPYAKLEIDGHTDPIGPKAYNQKLSEARAQALRGYFIQHYDIAPSRIVVRGFGKTRPEGTNGTTEGRAYNRRAVARIYRLDPAAIGTDRQTL